MDLPRIHAQDHAGTDVEVLVVESIYARPTRADDELMELGAVMAANAPARHSSKQVGALEDLNR